MFDVVKVLHIIGGFFALFTFLIPVVTRKGGKVHRLAGWVYTAGMGIVAISAFYMGAARLVDPESSPELISFSVFLLFIAVLSSSTAWYGLRVLKFKKRLVVHRHAVDLGFSFALLLSAAATSIYGFMIGSSLLSWFPVVGIALAFVQLNYWLRKPDERMHWWYEHLGGMLGCSISTITAFTVFGAPRLLNIESVSLLLWFLPTILLTPVIIGMTVYYKKKFSARSVSSAA
ncbi:DUF2306 domain-containing protein [Jeotgalibacillus sp. R-1-5s-1]|uniref:DUF2306 domain-containing protein n=1 Tax=Jeotgalibacillus sp. R-1-5s-1 TaxID=2555897 RepID=UPI00106D7503|nr:DUF2306 domain-containing protein [Jeotgalibacillus sp. R-1-5s-1]TFE00767.1 DUF2306 domain-containing protein [Jeotgalibacillus sp. R-1-5s-1]